MQICAEDDPYPLNKRNVEKAPRTVIRVPDEEQESLQSEIVPDPLEVDQLMMPPPQAPSMEKKKVLKKVPKGYSAYQAAWIVEDEENIKVVEEEEDKMDDDSMVDDYEKTSVVKQEEEEDEQEEYEYIDVSETQTAVDKTFNIADDEKMTDEERRAERERIMALREAQQEDAEFPDEVETPMDVPARVRFQKYRGLQNFRTSKWDPKENLPLGH